MELTKQGWRAAAVILLAAMVPTVEASPARAQRHYKAGEYKSALSEYEKLLGKAPNDARLHYNAGAAAYQATKFDQAIKEFQASAASPDLDLQQQSFYNLANAEFRLGEGNSTPQEKSALWEQAVQHYEAALKLNPSDSDAEFNRDLVRRKLEELKKEQEKQDQKSQENKNDDKKDQNQDNKQDQQQKDKQENKSDQQKGNESKQQEDEKKQQNNKSQEQKDSEQKKQEEQQKEQEARDKKSDQQKSDQSQAKKGGDKEAEEQQKDAEEAGQYAQLGKMTPIQAKQLLDAQRGEEKALIFMPPERKSNSNRQFKDW